MKSVFRICLLASALALATAPLMVQAQTTAPSTAKPAAKSAPKTTPASVTKTAAKSTFKTPYTAFGQPDLQGIWSNVSMTPLQRPAQYGTRLEMTPEEVKAAEDKAKENVDYENMPTDPNAGATDTTRKNCSGPGGRDCGYNAGWKDSTTTVMRVNGQPRTSFITFPADGRIPPAIASNDPAAAAALRREAAEAAAGEGTDPGPSAAPAPARGGGRGGAGAAGGRGGGVAAAGGRGGAGAAGRGGAGGGRGGGGGGAANNGPANPENLSLGERCVISFGGNAGPPMLPNGYYNNNIQIVQGKDSVAIWVEMNDDVRIVRLGGAHRTDGIRPYFGDSIGHWEGKTLVVETTNFNPGTSFQGSSANLKVTERFTRVANDRLLYQFKIEDPTRWSVPWGGEYEFNTTNGIYEYACHEGNYAMEDMLAGARELDRQATAAQGGANARPQPATAR